MNQEAWRTVASIVALLATVAALYCESKGLHGYAATLGAVATAAGAQARKSHVRIRDSRGPVSNPDPRDR